MENEAIETPVAEIDGLLKRTVQVVASKKEEFEERVKELSKKLKKEVKTEYKGLRKVQYEGKDDEGESFPYEVTFAVFEIEVDLQYSMNGYTFFAQVKDEGDNPLVISPDPEAFKRLNLDRVFKCPHCNKTFKNRKTKVYLQKDGELFAFGSSCATEYFGDSYKYLTKNLGFFEGFDEDCRGYGVINKNDIEKFYNTVALSILAFKTGIEFKKLVETERNGRKEIIEVKAKDRVEEILGYYNLIAKNRKNLLNDLDYKYGDTFYKKEIETRTLTAEQIQEFKEMDIKQIEESTEKNYNTETLWFDSTVPRSLRKTLKETIAGKDFAGIIKFYEGMEPKDNFGFNLKTQFTSQGNLVGILVYGVYKYFWDEAKKTMIPKDKETWNRFPGEVGAEIKNVKVKLLRFTSFETGFGEKFVYTFVTENREQLTVFFTGMIAAHNGRGPDGPFEGAYGEIEKIPSTDMDEGFYKVRKGEVKFEVGMEFIITKAKIKEQKDYKGTPQTTLKLSRGTNIVKVG